MSSLDTDSAQTEWETVADIALVQAVGLFGEDSWQEVCDSLGQNFSLKFKESLTPKACSQEFARLLASLNLDSNNGAESNLSSAKGEPTSHVHHLLRRLSISRKKEIKQLLHQCEIEYDQTCLDIASIENGTYDEKLLQMLPSDPDSVESSPNTTAPPEEAAIDVTPSIHPPPIQLVSDHMTRNSRSTDRLSRLPPLAPRQRGQSIPGERYLTRHASAAATASTNRTNHDTESVDADSGTEYSDGPDRKRQRTDEKYKTWKRTAMLIWNRIADHRAGNAFLKISKEKKYTDFVKRPMSLDLVKSRIREGATRTTAEFHRDVLHVLANVVMFSSEESELYAMAMEMREYVDSEMRSLLVCTARGDDTRQ
ncbi:hypothetical protein BASA61_004930 [Batrachochytrium salamandrivorans]|nr:hypothetical protein BASA61_004930 [Batrachochytrium salamandrivorans]KAH9252677.1 hypothetical protein BASA81_009369 [Batrachochytrium salamandrivorans]KAH9267521.1 hypothetical protein BASA83_009911 [Batrachochytrium salamandrivorans]